jgi:deoxyhypusine synthase
MESTQNIVYKECNLDFIDRTNIIKGHDFNKSNDLQDIMESYKLTGIQADNLYQAICIIRQMLKNRETEGEERCHIYLGVSNSVILQQRSAIAYMC